MPDAFPLPPLEPTRDPKATLPDLIEVLLNEGVIVHLDLIIAVADIPLIGVSLKAAIAGIETMLEYGMMRQWDEQTRAWVQRSISRSVPFDPDEELIARIAGGIEDRGLYTAWRPGTIYLTNRRLFVFRREPREMLWETGLEAIEAVEPDPQRSVGGEERLRLRISLAGGSSAVVSAAEPERFVMLLRRQVMNAGGNALTAVRRSAPQTAILREGQVWYHEPRAGGALWRGGVARLDAVTGLSWKSPMDVRAAVTLRPEEIQALDLEGGHSPGGSAILVVQGTAGNIRFAADDIAGWADALASLLDERSDAGLRLLGASEAGGEDEAWR